jgi:cytosine deaminase
MDLVVKNARLANRKETVDLSVKNGIFEKVDTRLDVTADREIDAAGNLVVPPFIDSHLHLDAALTA